MELKIANFNMRSMGTGFVEFKDHVHQFDYDIIALSETWLNPDISSDTFKLNGFQMIRNDRMLHGGGLAYYIKNNISFTVINTNNSEHFEQLWLLITIGKKRLSIGAVYRARRKDYDGFFNALEDSFASVIPFCDDMLCVGDFNIDFLTNNSNCLKFVDLLEAYDFKQIITEPTRVTKSSSTLIDPIITSNLEIICDKGVRSMHGISDHSLAYCHLKIGFCSNEAKFKTFRDFNNFNHDAFTEALQGIPWDIMLRLNDIDAKVKFFSDNILLLFNYFAPIRTARLTKPRAPWLTDNVKLLIKLRNNALNKFKRSKNGGDWDYYKTLRNFTTSAIRREKRAYFQAALTKNKNNVWSALKSLNVNVQSKNRVIPPTLCDANAINNFFINEITAKKIQPDPNLKYFYQNNLKNNGSHFFSFSLATMDDVVDSLSTITSNSVGADNISINMIKMCCPFIIKYLLHIINCCLEIGYFPDDWKIAHVIPLPKINSPSDLKDLRPISILPAVSKLLEKIMGKQIRQHLTSFNILPSVQSGFRKGYSCTSALASIMDDIFNALDNNMATVLILLDYSKAFDMIDHELLLSKLHYFGFDNNAIELIKSFLAKRIQLVKINDTISNAKDVESGVPQGSILGPLLYIIYTADFIDNIKNCKCHFYADDTQLYLPFNFNDTNNANNLINSDLSNLVTTSEHHSLLINPLKSAVMLFCKPKDRDKILPLININIAGATVPVQISCRNLGLTIDTNLKFHSHINSCVQKAFNGLKVLYVNRHFLTIDAKRILCNAFVLSHFNFADLVYGPCLDSADVKRVQRIQNSCLRLVYGIRKYDHISHKLRDIKWLNMRNRRLLHFACFMHKLLITKTPSYLCDRLTFRTDVHNINIRNKGLLTIPIHKSVLFESCFSYSAAKIYNSLPLCAKDLSLSSFKKYLSAYLFDHQDSLI